MMIDWNTSAPLIGQRTKCKSLGFDYMWFWPPSDDNETPQSVTPLSCREHDVSFTPPLCSVYNLLYLLMLPGKSGLYWDFHLTVCVYVQSVYAGLAPRTCSFVDVFVVAVWDELKWQGVRLPPLFFHSPSPPVKWLLRSFNGERRCGPLSDSCRLLWACACWLMAPLKWCSCQSSTFIRPRYLVIVIPQWEKKVGRWVQVGADVIQRSRLTGPHL